jgi:predicted nucleic acid-binding protein
VNVFFDASAFTKRYVNEVGSDRVEKTAANASAVAVSVICLAEVTSALCRLVREGSLSKQQYRVCKQALVENVQDATVIHISDDVMRRAVGLLERWPLRASDALQVASAAEWGADLFASADTRQCKAAEGCGLTVERLAVM